MKKTEAISILATSVRPREPKDRARYDEAVKMAIEALKCSETSKSSERTAKTAQDVSDSDLISRKAAVADTVHMELFDRDYPVVPVGVLNSLPSEQPETKWIPCSERLPEDLAEVNVTWVNHEPEPYYEFIKSKPFTASAVYYEGKWYWYSSVCADVLGEYGRNDVDKVDDTIEIIAWMPLPEPYRGGDE